MVDPTRGSGLLFFVFQRPQPYTCLGIEWLTQGGVVYYNTIFRVSNIKGPNPTPVWELNHEWLTQGGVVYYFSCFKGPNPTPVWELNVVGYGTTVRRPPNALGKGGTCDTTTKTRQSARTRRSRSSLERTVTRTVTRSCARKSRCPIW